MLEVWLGLWPLLVWPRSYGAPAPPRAPVTVHCGPGHMVVSVSPDLLGRGRPVRPMELGLGGCSPTGLGAVVRFEVELHDCGSTLEVREERAGPGARTPGSPPWSERGLGAGG